MENECTGLAATHPTDRADPAPNNGGPRPRKPAPTYGAWSTTPAALLARRMDLVLHTSPNGLAADPSAPAALVTAYPSAALVVLTNTRYEGNGVLVAGTFTDALARTLLKHGLVDVAAVFGVTTPRASGRVMASHHALDVADGFSVHDASGAVVFANTLGHYLVSSAKLRIPLELAGRGALMLKASAAGFDDWFAFSNRVEEMDSPKTAAGWARLVEVVDTAADEHLPLEPFDPAKFVSSRGQDVYSMALGALRTLSKKGKSGARGLDRSARLVAIECGAGKADLDLLAAKPAKDADAQLRRDAAKRIADLVTAKRAALLAEHDYAARPLPAHDGLHTLAAAATPSTVAATPRARAWIHDAEAWTRAFAPRRTRQPRTLDAALNAGPESSDLAAQLLANAGETAAGVLLATLAECLRTRTLPKPVEGGARPYVVFPSSRVPVDRVRSTTLGGALAAVLAKILTERVRTVLDAHPDILRGAEQLKTVTTTGPRHGAANAHVKAAAALACVSPTSPWRVFASHTTAAYAVPREVVEGAMRRVRMPEEFVELSVQGVMGGKQGIPRGRVESRIVWEIVYDVVLGALAGFAEEVKRGGKEAE
ncbi:hypothetical protein H9P43_009381 [Blastocladiella emersonii ATCC 22665]|nr:hypothetical protein H9P43_009381 [Blastocladiella emersonii ATCC 22665]